MDKNKHARGQRGTGGRKQKSCQRKSNRLVAGVGWGPRVVKYFINRGHLMSKLEWGVEKKLAVKEPGVLAGGDHPIIERSLGERRQEEKG